MDLSNKILSDVVVFMKYAKFVPELNRRENWNELVTRNKNMHVKKYPNLKDEIEVAYKFVYDKKVLPSMRSMQFAGKPIELNPARGYNCSFLPMDDPEAFSELMFLLLSGVGVGYALPLDTDIPTPVGWTTMENIVPGDEVFDDMGMPTKVLQTSKIFEDHNIFEITFKDGSSIKADENHLWNIQTRGIRNSELRWEKQNRGVRKDNWEITTPTKCLKPGMSIRVSQALDLPAQKLPLDPYVFGYWLGDGYRTRATISTADKFITEEIDRLGYSCKKLKKKYDWNVAHLHSSLHEMKLIGSKTEGGRRIRNGIKEIPQYFLRASYEQRLHLLQGLMDSDGTITKRNRCIFAVVNETLAKQVYELTLSLGIKSTFRKNDWSIRAERYNKALWEVSFTTDVPVFRLPRKLQRMNKIPSNERKRRFISSIKKVPSVPVKCISVNSPSKLYLAGKDFLVTHNSVQVHHVEKLPEIVKPRKTKRYLVGDSIEGWSDAVKVLVKSYFSGRPSPEFDFSDIRPKGARLITSGGKAPGPEPLKDCLHNVQKILDRKETGEQLTTLEVHDINCYIADAVLAGGIRRCLPEQYSIQLESGEWKPIAEINIGDKVLVNGMGYPVIGKINNGVQDLIKINTFSGYHISTPNHRWLVFNEETQSIEWIEAQYIIPEKHSFLKFK